ncbi:MAG: hypothetical protein NVSMB21_09520 [Vulcanimicrobiaceae bacterium]
MDDRIANVFPSAERVAALSVPAHVLAIAIGSGPAVPVARAVPALAVATPSPAATRGAAHAARTLAPTVANDDCAQSFAIGQTVEADRAGDRRLWTRGTVVDAGVSRFPSYRVRFADGSSRLLFCRSVYRATERSAPRVVERGASEPPLGSYVCTYGPPTPPVRGPGRAFQLLPGGRYGSGDGEIGRYVFSAGSRSVRFVGGYYARISASGTFARSRIPRIDIDPLGGVETSCRLR